MPDLQFDPENLTIDQLIVFEEYADRQKRGETITMADVRTLMAVLLGKSEEDVGKTITSKQMKEIMAGMGRAQAQVVERAVPLVTSDASSPTATDTDTTLQPGS